MLIRMHDGTLKEIQINHYDNVSFIIKICYCIYSNIQLKNNVRLHI